MNKDILAEIILTLIGITIIIGCVYGMSQEKGKTPVDWETVLIYTNLANSYGD